MPAFIGSRRSLLGAPAQGLVTRGLQALWMPALDYFPGITAQTVPDRSGNGNTLTLGSTAGVDANDPSWSQQGLVGNGTSEYCKGPSAAAPAGNAALTEFVVFNAASNSGYPTWIATGNQSNGVANSPSIFVSSILGSNQVFGSSGQAAALTSVNIGRATTGTWIAAFLRYTPAGSDGTLTLQVPSHSATIASVAVSGANWDNTGVRLLANLASGAMANYCNGTVAAAGFYDRDIGSSGVARDCRWLRDQLAPSGIMLP